MSEATKPELTDVEKASWEKFDKLIDAKLSGVAASLDKDLKKRITESGAALQQSLTTAVTGLLDEKLKELKPPENTEHTDDGKDGKQPKPDSAEIAALKAEQKKISDRLGVAEKERDAEKKEKERIQLEKRETDYHSALDNLLSGAQVNSIPLARRALLPETRYTDDKRIEIKDTDGDYILLTPTILKNWLDADGSMFLRAQGGGSGARNGGDGRSNSGGKPIMDELDAYASATDEAQKALRHKLVDEIRASNLG